LLSHVIKGDYRPCNTLEKVYLFSNVAVYPFAYSAEAKIFSEIVD